MPFKFPIIFSSDASKHAASYKTKNHKKGEKGYVIFEWNMAADETNWINMLRCLFF